MPSSWSRESRRVPRGSETTRPASLSKRRWRETAGRLIGSSSAMSCTSVLAAVQELHDGAAPRVAEGLERITGHGLDGNQQARSYLTLPTSWMWSASGAAERPGQAEPVQRGLGHALHARRVGGLALRVRVVREAPTSTECCGVR